jgi:hypothetical protein
MTAWGTFADDSLAGRAAGRDLRSATLRTTSPAFTYSLFTGGRAEEKQIVKPGMAIDSLVTAAKACESHFFLRDRPNRMSALSICSPGLLSIAPLAVGRESPDVAFKLVLHRAFAAWVAA